MIKIFSSNINGLVLFKGCNIINNYLVISSYLANIKNVDGCNTFNISRMLVVINMKKRITITCEELDTNIISIVDDMIYSFKDGNIDTHNFSVKTISDEIRQIVYLNKFEDGQKIIGNILENNDIPIDNLVDSIIYKLNGEIYYCVYSNLLLDDTRDKFIFRKLKDNSKFIIVRLSCENISVEKSEDDFIICLPFESCQTLHHNDTLIFFDKSSTYVKVNVNTGTFNSMDIKHIWNSTKVYSRISDIKVASNYEILIQYGPILHDSDVDNRTKVIYNFIDDSFEILKFDKYIVAIRLFIHNGRKYYIIVDKSFEFSIYVRESDYFKNICDVMNDNSTITIGTECEKVEMSFGSLMKKSYFINSLFNDLKKNDNNSLISDNFKNISIYKKFVENKEYDADNLYDLYVIANYMQDCDINYLAEIIISHVRESNISIEESFKYLELLRTSTCDEQFIVLIHVVFKKYDNNLFLSMISDEKLLLNNYIRKTLEYELKQLSLGVNNIDDNKDQKNFFSVLRDTLKLINS